MNKSVLMELSFKRLLVAVPQTALWGFKLSHKSSMSGVVESPGASLKMVRGTPSRESAEGKSARAC